MLAPNVTGEWVSKNPPKSPPPPPTIGRRLEELHAAGRLSMSHDPSNTEWRELDDAVRAALASLDVAIQATAWMDTAL